MNNKIIKVKKKWKQAIVHMKRAITYTKRAITLMRINLCLRMQE